MPGNINPAYRGLGIATEDPKEWIEGRSRICIQESIAQARRAGVASEHGHIVPGITKTRFPIPVLEVIAKFSQLAAKSGIEQHIIVGEFNSCHTSVVDAAKADPGVNRRAIRQTGVRHRKGIKRILDWHTDALRTNWNAGRIPERIGRKGSSRQGRIKE